MTEPITPEEIATLAALIEATPNLDWIEGKGGTDFYNKDKKLALQNFIAAARTALPRLLAERTAREERLREAERHIRANGSP